MYASLLFCEAWAAPQLTSAEAHTNGTVTVGYRQKADEDAIDAFKIGGEVAKVESSAVDGSRKVVVVVDATGYSPENLRSALDLVFEKALSDTDAAYAIIVAAEAVHLIPGAFGPAKPQVDAAEQVIARVRRENGTVFASGLLAAADLLEESDAADRRILAIGDGVIARDSYGIGDVVLPQDVHLDAGWIVSPRPETILRAGQRDLQRLARESGGTATNLAQEGLPTSVPDQLVRVELTPNPVPAGDQVALVELLSDGGVTAKADVTFPKDVDPCAPGDYLCRLGRVGKGSILGTMILGVVGVAGVGLGLVLVFIGLRTAWEKTIKVNSPDSPTSGDVTVPLTPRVVLAPDVVDLELEIIGGSVPACPIPPAGLVVGRGAADARTPGRWDIKADVTLSRRHFKVTPHTDERCRVTCLDDECETLADGRPLAEGEAAFVNLGQEIRAGHLIFRVVRASMPVAA